MMTNKKIFALNFQFRTELELVEPVIKLLNQETQRCYCIFFKGLGDEVSMMIDLARQKGLPYKVLSQTLDAKTEEELSKKRVEFDQALAVMMGGSADQKACIHKGVDLRSLLKPCILRHLSVHHILNALRCYELVKKLFDNEKPGSLLLSSGHSLLNRLCCSLAESRGIRTVIIPHYSSQISTLTADARNFFKLSPFSYWAVMGKTFKEVLVQAGADPDRIIVSGLPKFNSPLKKGPVSSFKKSFLLTLQGFPEDKLILDALAIAMKDFPDKFLIVRPHPLVKDGKFLGSIMKRIPKNILLMRENKLEDLLENCEIMMTVTSATVFEAILCDRPVIILNLASRYYPHIFIKEGAALEVNRICDIVPTVHKVLSNLEVKRTLSAGRQRILENYSPGRPVDSVQLICDIFK